MIQKAVEWPFGVSGDEHTTQIEAKQEPVGTGGQVELAVIKGALKGTRFRLNRGEVVIGKAEDADIQIPDSGVSRRHAKLIVDEESIQLVDLASTNGTFVNGVGVDSTTLKCDDVIHVGAVAELQVMTAASPLSELSARQLEVAELVAQGLTNAVIAERLEISPRTVSSHLDHIYDRLGLRSRAALASWLVHRTKR